LLLPLPFPCPAATGVTKADINRTTVNNIDTIRIFFFTNLNSANLFSGNLLAQSFLVLLLEKVAFS
jgi:hypothetical protein